VTITVPYCSIVTLYEYLGLLHNTTASEMLDAVAERTRMRSTRSRS